MADTETKPAPVDWRGFCHDDGRGVQVRRNTVGSLTVEQSYVGEGIGWRVEIVDTSPTIHALAALCLYGQPFGFDKAEVEWLRTRCNKSEDVDVVGMRILSKIEALLPPSP